MATQPQGQEQRRPRFVPRPASNPRMPVPTAKRPPARAPQPEPDPEAELEPIEEVGEGEAEQAPQADPQAQRHKEIEALRAQYGSCIWRLWVRAEGGNRLSFTPVYIQVDAEDRSDGTTVIRHAGRSWVLQTASIDTEVLGLERAVEERWINREDYRAFLF